MQCVYICRTNYIFNSILQIYGTVELTQDGATMDGSK